MQRHLISGGLLLIYVTICVRPASAQIAQGEIVLPTIGVFAVGTTVSVPDRGGMVLGGADSASTTRSEFGPGFGRGLSSRTSALGANVRVWVHDFREMEGSLARGGEDEPPPTGFAGRMRHYASNRVAAAKEKAKRESASAKTAHEERLAAKIEQAADLLKRGQDAESRGKLKIARMYYKSVVSLGSTPSARAADERLNALETKLAGR